MFGFVRFATFEGLALNADANRVSRFHFTVESRNLPRDSAGRNAPSSQGARALIMSSVRAVRHTRTVKPVELSEIFIVPPYEDCPFCGSEDAFGLLSVEPHSFTKCCKKCSGAKRRELSRVSKALIYLDQFAVSNLAKCIHPDYRERFVEGNPQTQNGFWPKAFEALDRLQMLHVAACPQSTVHRAESVLNSRLREILRELYEHLSGHLAFRDPSQILDQQILKALSSFLAGEDFQLGERADVIDGPLDGWIDTLRISVDLGLQELEAEQAQKTKARAQEKLQALFSEAQSQPRRDYRVFRDDYTACGPTWALNPYSPVGIAIMRRLDQEEVPIDERDELLREFLVSEQLRSVPAFRLKMCLLAAFAADAAGGRGSPPQGSMWFDIQGISAFLPYCDAILVDKQCKRWLRTIADHDDCPWPARIFSVDDTDAFLAYLQKLEEDAGPERRQLAIEVYGEQRLKPFSELYEWRDST